MASDVDDLARTATAGVGAGDSTSTPTVDLGGSLGRFRIERELGAGGMGVVHAAFDPDLERRVALKVLRADAGSREARERLQREARAMARLTHENVVTVHEVGTVDGRDFIAMELVDGGTLADWLKDIPRKHEDIVAAFIAAGRGLAAAHAAGLVHRDFKPHNVLRRRDGKIVVTDFGLARGVEAAPNISLETTVRAGKPMTPAPAAVAAGTGGTASAPSGPTPLGGITATGSVLGTPAYMAPEQWLGGTIGPAADQFAFCVALWEALTGERPFRGETLDALRAEVARGPSAKETARLPRGLRAILRRGLEPDPAKRWPSMDELLAQLARPAWWDRRRQRRVIVGLGALAVALIIDLVGGHHRGNCAAPALDPAAVWNVARAAAVAAGGQGAAIPELAADATAWDDGRGRACSAPAQERSARLACLDGVIARFDAVADALAPLGGQPPVAASNLLIDPRDCESAKPPRLARTVSPELHAVLGASLLGDVDVRPQAEARAVELVKRSEAEPCASALAHSLAAAVRAAATDRVHDRDLAEQAAQRCGDDWVIGSVLIEAAMSEARDELSEADALARAKRAEATVDPKVLVDLSGDLEELRGELADRADRVDEAIQHLDAAIAAYTARDRLRDRLRVELRVLTVRWMRGTPDDLHAVTARLGQLKQLAASRLARDDRSRHLIKEFEANWQIAQGDVVGATATWDASYSPTPNDHPIRVTGTVVDGAGKPIAGARVAASRSLRGTPLSIVIPADSTRYATTGADGSFVIPDADADSSVVAQLGALRSMGVEAADHVSLVLEPTSQLSGHVELAGVPAVNVGVLAYVAANLPPRGRRQIVMAPVLPDGSFTLDGVPRGKILVTVTRRNSRSSTIEGTELDVHDPVVTGLKLAVSTSSRVVNVIVRSTVSEGVAAAQVVVMPGKVASTNLALVNKTLHSAAIRMARPIDDAPAAVAAKANRGDLYATIAEVPAGEASACAVGLPGSIDAELGKKLVAHMDRVAVVCTPIGATDDVVIVEVPPFPRLD